VSTLRIAFLCPGQGAQKVGMGQELAAAFPEARKVFDTAFATLGAEFEGAMWNGPEDNLRQTVNAQPALLVHSVAALRVLEARGLKADFAAGHSLGEYSAHVAAGSLEFEDALRLVRRRGELMHEAGNQRAGTMAAILGLEAKAVETVCRQIRESGGGEVVAANLNSPNQVVISGEVGAVETAMQAAKEAGARRAVPLDVSGAFHSALMAPAAEGLRQALAKVKLNDASFPVIANATALPVSSAEEIRRTLGDQLLSPVRWEQSVRTLLELEARIFVEIGCGSVLRGLVKAVQRDATLAGVEDPASLDATLTTLTGVGVEVVV
jgi:[acyl-carrier-protein] S-malonyltransferase